MTQQPDSSRIVNIGDRQPPEGRAGGLLSAVRAITLKHAQTLTGSLFENVDDALFDLAEKAESNAVQTQFFDGMREVRKKRQLVDRLFLDYTGRNFDSFAAGKPGITAGGPAPQRPGTEGELSLVDDRELEESLAVTSMIAKAENRYARVLYAVNQRLSVISGGRKVNDTENPLGPTALAYCFRRAMHELEADVRVKLIVYKLFERYVLSGLDPLYDAVNAELVGAGVLPQLHHRVTRQPANPASPAAPEDGAAVPTAAAAAPTAAATTTAIDAAHAALREQLYATINDLLSARRTVHAAPGPSAPALEVGELISAITLLQQQAPPVPAEREQLTPRATLSVDELRHALHEKIEQLGISSMGSVSGADADTIDLVGMLFEYILEDRNLPAPMQAMLGRLQIPYLKVALLDKQLFAQPTHPARRLLETLSEAAKGWSEASDHDQRLFNEIKGVVNTLLHTTEDDAGLYDRLLAKFRVFTEGNQQRAKLAEQRTAEASRGREKLQTARRIAAREVLSRTQGRQLPELIQNILTRPWANYLVLTLLRDGEQSPEWRTALRFMDELIWSAGSIATDADRQRLHAILPGIEKHLRHGLSTVSFQDADLRRLMRALGQFYHRQLGQPIPPELVAEEVTIEQAPLIPDAVEAIATPAQAAPEPVPPEAIDPDLDLAPARALRVGNWVEFITAEGQHDRAKLSWISPISGKYLFVNRRGLKVCDMNLQMLAASIAAGHTVVLEEVPLFDRALDAIVERLRRDQPQPAATHAADTSAADAQTAPSADANDDDPESAAE